MGHPTNLVPVTKENTAATSRHARNNSVGLSGRGPGTEAGGTHL